jgi:hypothetical protein
MHVQWYQHYFHPKEQTKSIIRSSNHWNHRLTLRALDGAMYHFALQLIIHNCVNRTLRNTHCSRQNIIRHRNAVTCIWDQYMISDRVGLITFQNPNELINSKWFWRWCKTLGIMVFFRLGPSPRILKTKKTQRFGDRICFRPQVRGKTPTLLGPLERANLNHWNLSHLIHRV